MQSPYNIEFKSLPAQGLNVLTWGMVDWHSQQMVTLFEEEALVGVGFTSSLFTLDEVVLHLARHLRPLQLNRDDQTVNQLFQRFQKLEIPLRLYGTAFQHDVWQALSSIPQSHTTSYQKIAQAIQKPLAARAVGQAIGRNPVAYFIPCHRVLANNGKLGGFLWGADVKQALLALDQTGY